MKLGKYISLLALMLSFIVIFVITYKIYYGAEYRYQNADFYELRNHEVHHYKLNVDRVDVKIYKMAGFYDSRFNSKILSEISIPRHDARQLVHSLNNMSFIPRYQPIESMCFMYEMEIITRLQFASVALDIAVCNYGTSTVVWAWYRKFNITSIHWFRAEADPVFHNIISKLEAYE